MKDLGDPRGGLEDRLRAFLATSVSALLYNAAGWHLTEHVLLRIKRWENHKLRRMLHLRRRPEENRGGHMLRTGQRINAWFQKLAIQRTHEKLLALHHGWAAMMVAHTTGRGAKPMYHLLRARCLQHWRETREGNAWIDPSNQSGWRHSKSGPQSHWEQVLAKVHGESWWDAPLADPSAWRSARHDFVRRVCEMFGMQRQSAAQKPVAFVPKCTLTLPQWLPGDMAWGRASMSFEFRVDNAVVANWMTGAASVTVECFRDRVAVAAEVLQELIFKGGWCTRWPHADWVKWVPRELNVIADALANRCLDLGHNIAVQGAVPEIGSANMVLVSDGARRGADLSCAASWAVLAFTDNGISFVAGGAVKFPAEVSSLDAEFTGLELAIGALLKYNRGYHNLAPHSADTILDASELLRGNGQWLALP